jgi:hypothetical protein
LTAKLGEKELGR